MKLSSSILVLALAATAGTSIAATGGVPTVDYTRTNARFAPSTTSLRPEPNPHKLAPAPRAARVRFEKRSFAATPVSKSKAFRSTPVVQKQKRLSPDFRRPKARSADAEQLGYPNQPYVISPEVRSFGRASRYQSQLSSANAVYIGRTPTLDRSGMARVNRFLFRRSDEATEVITPEAARVGAGGAAHR